ncbi:MAG: PLP-dependent aminotransferase family protein [Acetobacteraceae bacterium]
MAIPITLDPSLADPLYLQIANHLRAAAIAGTLPAGGRLPSARSLASQLSVARGTVYAAYAVLAGEGAVETRGPSGTVISPHLNTRVDAPEQSALALTDEAPAAAPLAFRMGLPALDAFPSKQWAGLMARTARSITPADLASADPAGFPPLRQAIAAYLGASRGIICSPAQIIVTAGFQGALALVRQVLVRPGDAVWVEDPGYPNTRQALEAGGARLVPVRVDRDGMRVAAGIVAAPRARLAVVTPTHQSPLGVAMALPRRTALLAWAAEAGAWVLEDDYDSEFRYTGRPLPALKSLDRGQRVLFAGSFSKVLFPGLRLGYLIVPDELSTAFLRASRLQSCGLPAMEQRVVAAFMQQGHFARHLRRMRSLYAARRKALALALAVVFRERVAVELESGGLHLLARFLDDGSDDVLARRAARAGLGPTALSGLAMAHDAGQGLLLGFTNIPEAQSMDAVQRLAGAFAADA